MSQFTRLSKAATLVLLLLSSVMGLWQVSYPDQNDPKNLRYVLWKHGLASFNLDQACSTMIGDGDRSARKLVIGKSKDQLVNRFGFLTQAAEADPYYAHAYSTLKMDQDAAYLRHSPWLVVFKDGRATELILVKGY